MSLRTKPDLGRERQGGIAKPKLRRPLTGHLAAAQRTMRVDGAIQDNLSCYAPLPGLRRPRPDQVRMARPFQPFRGPDRCVRCVGMSIRRDQQRSQGQPARKMLQCSLPQSANCLRRKPEALAPDNTRAC